MYKIVLQEAWHGRTAHVQDDKKQLLRQLSELEDKRSYIRNLLSSRQIEPEDFREMKSDYNQKVEKLQARLSGLSHPEVNMKDLLDKGIDTLLRADYIYETADTEKKRRLIGSMFPEKMHFEKSSLRTGRVNEAVRFIYRIDSALGENKNRTNENKSHLSCDVALPVQISNLFLVV